MGVKSKTIHSLSQALGTGVVFLELQLKEYTAAFFTFRDSIFGSDLFISITLVIIVMVAYVIVLV